MNAWVCFAKLELSCEDCHHCENQNVDGNHHGSSPFDSVLSPCFRCYLNPKTHFIWAFIAPVLVIMFINVAFIIMAATVMWRHKKKLTGKMEAKKIKNWLKALLSLTVIMGVTWIFGVLIVEVQALIPLAYIYTILVAFQGVVIFILFVVLDSKVRGDCTKAWRSTVKKPDILSSNFRSSSKSTSVSLGLGGAFTNCLFRQLVSL